MQIRFLEIAQVELDEVVVNCEREKDGLGDDVLSEALNAPDRIASFPEAWLRFSLKRAGSIIRHTRNRCSSLGPE